MPLDSLTPNSSLQLFVGKQEISLTNAQSFLGSVNDQNPLSLTYEMGFNVTVESRMYVDVLLSQVTYMGTLLSAQGNEFPNVSLDGATSNLVVQSRENSTFPLVATTRYQTTSVVGLATDPALQAMLSQCAAQALSFRFKVVLSIAAISWTGYRPTIERDIKTPCPPSAESFIASIRLFGGLGNIA